jgi:hypothetical protein
MKSDKSIHSLRVLTLPFSSFLLFPFLFATSIQLGVCVYACMMGHGLAKVLFLEQPLFFPLSSFLLFLLAEET